MQEMLQCLRSVQDIHPPPLHPQLNGMMKQYVRMVEEHLCKIMASHQRDWDATLSVFLLTYRTSIWDTVGLNTAKLLFRRELHLPCDLQFVAHPSTTSWT
jgi:hypothetical protein